MFVNHETKVGFGLLHLPQDVVEPGCINDVKRRLQHVLESKLFGAQQKRHHIFAVYEANHVID